MPCPALSFLEKALAGFRAHMALTHWLATDKRHDHLHRFDMLFGKKGQWTKCYGLWLRNKLVTKKILQPNHL